MNLFGQIVSRLILLSLNSKKNHMKSDFCKPDPNHMARWFEIQFPSRLYRCVLSVGALVLHATHHQLSQGKHVDGNKPLTPQ